MRIAISATGDSPESSVHRQFGRCDWFIVFDETRQPVKAIRNLYAEAQTGAGIGCVQDLIREGVKVVIAGLFGPRAHEVCKQADVEMYLAPPDISVQEAYERFLSKDLRKMEITRF